MRRGFDRLLMKPITGVALVLTPKKMDGLGMAFEVARRLVETGGGAKLRLWSWQSFLSIGGMMLTGDSYTPGHRWTLTRGMLLESDERNKAARMQDSFVEWSEREVSLYFNSSCVNVGNGRIYLGDLSDVTILDFRGELDFRKNAEVWKLRLLNSAAMASGQTFVMVVDLSRSLGKSYDEKSYASLAMRLSVEYGIDLPSCAKMLVQLGRTEQDYWHPSVTWCRIMCEDDDLGQKNAFVVEKDDTTGRYHESYDEDVGVSEY